MLALLLLLLLLPPPPPPPLLLLLLLLLLLVMIDATMPMATTLTAAVLQAFLRRSTASAAGRGQPANGCAHSCPRVITGFMY